ncbi:hypothetical protein PsorP6_014644 [Peronosclerospora sorghi]|uniref:Uncharacterized protein n=1 Tax=Peronosclerospora sorghi TaxID=230839 RepID=A0ACC0VVC5_9STRA|nr:hypothetical protein PsorP6_014644 [Peronosclerospora sorghi]
MRIRSVYTLTVEHEHAMVVAQENAGNEINHTICSNYEKRQTAPKGLPNGDSNCERKAMRWMPSRKDDCG